MTAAVGCPFLHVYIKSSSNSFILDPTEQCVRVECSLSTHRVKVYYPLRSYTPTKEAYVNWTNEEIEYARKAYDIINPTLPPDQKRFIARELLKHIRNDPVAKGIFHASHLECSGKFRHVIREYITKGK